jgi:hypothetical protein
LKDLGQSVVVVEKQALLGGHVDTYTDPGTGIKVDIGVQTWFNYSVVRDFFERFNVPISPYTFLAEGTVYADFKAGTAFPNYQPNYSFTAYSAQLSKYRYLVDGFSLPNPVPGDLLLPFGAFLTKYSLGDIAWTIWYNTWGSGDVLKQPTLYMLKAFDERFIDALTEGSITSARRNNQEIFDKALNELGSNALVSSTVTAARRPTEGKSEKSKLVVSTPKGKKLVITSKVLVSAPPTMSNMNALNLDAQEESLFKQFTSSSFYVFLLTDTGLPAGYSFQNVRPTSNATFSIPPLPGLYNINPTVVDDLFSVWYGGPEPLTQAQMKEDIKATVVRLREVADGSAEGDVRFLDYSSHTPFQIAVPSDAISHGFYRELEELQGHRNTWYTGSAFVGNHAALLWNSTEFLLPSIIQG